MRPDIINGCFELLGGILNFINVYRVYKDKKLSGVSLIPTLFFTLWGFWNLYYYPHLNQWWSFFGGLIIVIANLAWVALAIYYTKIKGNHII